MTLPDKRIADLSTEIAVAVRIQHTATAFVLVGNPLRAAAEQAPK